MLSLLIAFGHFGGLLAGETGVWELRGREGWALFKTIQRKSWALGLFYYYYFILTSSCFLFCFLFFLATVIYDIRYDAVAP